MQNLDHNNAPMIRAELQGTTLCIGLSGRWHISDHIPDRSDINRQLKNGVEAVSFQDDGVANELSIALTSLQQMILQQ